MTNNNSNPRPSPPGFFEKGNLWLDQQSPQLGKANRWCERHKMGLFITLGVMLVVIALTFIYH